MYSPGGQRGGVEELADLELVVPDHGHAARMATKKE